MAVAWVYTSLKKFLCGLVQKYRLSRKNETKSYQEPISLLNSSTKLDMDGVILFADDKVFQQSYENEFFLSLLSEKKYPVVAVDNIDLLEKTVRSISTYKAVILDWNFIRKEEVDVAEGIEVPNENPSVFLLENDIYSLIYIYSDKLIEDTEDGK